MSTSQPFWIPGAKATMCKIVLVVGLLVVGIKTFGPPPPPPPTAEEEARDLQRMTEFCSRNRIPMGFQCGVAYANHTNAVVATLRAGGSAR